LPETHARRIAIGEFDALGLKRGTDVDEGAGVGGAGAALEIGQSLFGDAGAFGELLLGPIEKRAPGAVQRAQRETAG
jgi:hypothetical protein